MATWVGIFLNNLDRKSVRKLEVEADDEVTAITLLDLYDYDETWEHYSFVEVQKKEVLENAAGKSRLQKEPEPLICVPLVHAYIKSFFTTLVCVHCFSCFCLCKSSFYYNQSRVFNRIGFQVQCKSSIPSKQKENTHQHGLGWLAIADTTHPTTNVHEISR